MLLAIAGRHGEVAEWSNALDLKSSEPQGSEGSNPSLSVSCFRRYIGFEAIDCKIDNAVFYGRNALFISKNSSVLVRYFNGIYCASLGC